MEETNTVEQDIFDTINAFYKKHYNVPVADHNYCYQKLAAREINGIKQNQNYDLNETLEQSVAEVCKKYRFEQLATSKYNLIRDFAKYGRRN